MFRSGREHRGLIPYKAEIQEETQQRVFMTLSLPTGKQYQFSRKGTALGAGGLSPLYQREGKKWNPIVFWI